MTKFVAIGNISIDENLQDGSTCGGSVFYSSLLASKLGLEAVAITSFGKDFLTLKPNWHNVRVYPQLNPFSTTVGFIYDKNGNRQVIMKKEGGFISQKLLHERISDADIIFVCPIVHEINSELVSFVTKNNKGALVLVTPQGWLRDWKKEGEVIFQKPWDNPKEILSYTDVLIISEEDIQKNRSVLYLYRGLIKKGGIIVITQGSKGATAYRGKDKIFSKAYSTKVVDPTGAGDIFAAGFAIAWRETSSLEKSLQFANLAASFIVEGVGAFNMPTRAQIKARSKDR